MNLCGDCVDRLREGGTISYWLPTEEEPPPPPVERFAELFEAARVLLREGVTEEDQIYPTLAFANELGQGVVNFVEEKDRLVSAYSSDADSWDEAVDWFSRKHASMRPVGVVDGVLNLERIPVRVQVHNYPIADVVVPRVVTISVFPYRRSATPEQVAALYDERLSSAGIPHEQSASGQFPYFAFEDGYLLFEVGHKRTAVAPEHIGTVFPGPQTRVPPSSPRERVPQDAFGFCFGRWVRSLPGDPQAGTCSKTPSSYSRLRCVLSKRLRRHEGRRRSPPPNQRARSA